MKPPAFEYEQPKQLDEVLDLLRRHGDEAKLLAGGQSLVPLLNFRMLRPRVLIDINRVPELAIYEPAKDGSLLIGATTRHHRLEMCPFVRENFAILSEAMGHVAHLAIRNRGTIGGSLTHADPAAELPMMALLLDAEIRVRSAAKSRTIPAEEFFLAPLTTSLDEGEAVTEIFLPALPAKVGWAFEEFAHRLGDFAVAAIAAIVSLENDRIAQARIAMMGVDETPIRLRSIEDELRDQAYSDDLIRSAAQRASETVNPNSDLKASAEFRRHLVDVMTERVLSKAWTNALRGVGS
jgi:carbon-monoxide dehydrogenase medium subunit